ncbi:uncharacterized protein LOC122092705 [Macadamia integrifolia]|uniref:uncharacterized protein LOC122092705 n=1 Tax=Macadamia integrifolia TaxID=60698 RepID=UPI001C530721|nr:uncharacterized protein LOC122092705 [Macadamia integrifolia]
MAGNAACKRGMLLGLNSGICFSNFRTGFKVSSSLDQVCLEASFHGLSASSSSSLRFNRFYCSQISQLVKSNGSQAFLVDTLALVRRLEAQGVQSKHAEAMTAAIIEVLNDSLENVAQSFVSKAEMEKANHIRSDFQFLCLFM